MPTRFYLDISNTNASGPGASKSTTLPNGTNNTNTPSGLYDDGLLNPNTGFTGSGPIVFASLAQTARQSGRYAIMATSDLAAQTISAGTWTFNCYTAESSNQANSYFALCVYVWRPSTSSVVGFVYDSNAQLGSEWSISGGFVNFTFSGNSVTAQANDVLVLEVWYTSAQAKSSSYNLTAYFDDQEYIDAPQSILLFRRKRAIVIS
ncbi:MAG: hypothetical protein OEZ19_00165 [Paracoccaceae bacterium]|nr:hypothetical protein [Paracoccaceae bacterium]